MRYFWLGVSVFFAISFVPMAAARAACAGTEVLPTRVLVLVDGREETQPESSRIATTLVGALAQKGFYPVYLDVAAPLPATFDMSPIAGVISWFVTDLPDPQGVADWLEARNKDCGKTLPRLAIGEMGGGAALVSIRCGT